MKALKLILLIILFSTRAQSAIVILNGLTHVHTADTGSVITGKIVVKNNSKKEARVLIYKQDLIANCNSTIQYSDVNSHSFSLAKWLKTNIDEKLLAAEEEYTLTYTITIPQEYVEKGTYWSAIMVEGADPIREETNKGINVNSKIRYAVQIIADIGAYESPKLSFENVSLNKSETPDKIVEILMKNTSEYSSKVQLNLEILNANGEKLKTFDGQSKRIYPKNCNVFTIEIKDLPKGKYEGILIADNGKDLFGSNISLDIE